MNLLEVCVGMTTPGKMKPYLPQSLFSSRPYMRWLPPEEEANPEQVRWPIFAMNRPDDCRSDPSITAAGILPFAVLKKGLLFLLGKERFHPGWRDGEKWADFGGHREEGETVHQAAAREFYEETAGVITSLKDIQGRLQRGDFYCMAELFTQRCHYRCYLMRVPYKDYGSQFDSTMQFLDYVQGNRRCVEKSQLKWFTLGQLEDIVMQPASGACRYFRTYGRKYRLRPKFAQLLRHLISNLDLKRALT